MYWLNNPDAEQAQPNDICVIYVCYDRDEPCSDKNSCGAKACFLKGCAFNY